MPLFGGRGAYEDASGIYQDYLQKALAALRESQATGRGDIQTYLQQALGYGAPYREAGEKALQAYGATLGLGGGTAQQQALDRFQTSPGYQFALQEAQQASQRGAAARGLAGSGAEQAELARQAQGMAQQEYGGYQQRLAGLVGAGQQATAQAGQEALGAGGLLGQMGLQYGQDIGSLIGQMGAAQAQARMAEAASRRGFWGNLFGGLGYLGGGLIGKYGLPF